MRDHRSLNEDARRSSARHSSGPGRGLPALRFAQHGSLAAAFAASAVGLGLTAPAAPATDATAATASPRRDEVVGVAVVGAG